MIKDNQQTALQLNRRQKRSRCAGPLHDNASSIYINGKFITADPDFRIAQAVAIRDGRFLAVGEVDEIASLAGPATEIVDLGGQTVLPGLIDTHAHVEKARLLSYAVQFDGVASVAQAMDRVSAYAAKLPKGAWVRGSQWHPIAQLAERRFLTRQELDQAALNNPVCLSIGHFTMANSQALALAGVSRDTPDPEGGVIHRDKSTGEPDGNARGSGGGSGPGSSARVDGGGAGRSSEVRDAVLQ